MISPAMAYLVGRLQPYIIRTRACFARSVSVLSPHEASRQKVADILKKSHDIPLAPYVIGPGGCALEQSFTSGHIDLQLYLTDRNGNLVDPSRIQNSRSNNGYKTYIIHLKTLFADGFRLLQEFVDNGDDKEDIFQPLAALRSFLLELEEHEASLLRTIERDVKLQESEICTVLAVHLLSKLVYPEDKPYIVSNDYNYRPRFCPCSVCENKVFYGSTGFGSRELWYGRPDIMVFPKGAGIFSVFVTVRDELKEIENIEENVEKNADEMQTYTSGLEDEDNIKTIARQTITFSFYQKMYQKRFVFQEPYVSLIPYVAICKDGFDIYMYDMEHDVFLKNHSEPIPLWTEHNDSMRLNLSAVLYLWMIINHLNFKPKLTDALLQKVERTFGLNQYVSQQGYQLIEKTIQMKSFRQNTTLLKSRNFPGIPID